MVDAVTRATMVALLARWQMAFHQHANQAKIRDEAAKKAARGRISVRQIERMTYKSVTPPKPGSISIHDPNVKHMLGLMEEKYGTKVTLKPFVGGKGGHLIFHYYENEYLGMLYDLLMIEH